MRKEEIAVRNWECAVGKLHMALGEGENKMAWEKEEEQRVM